MVLHWILCDSKSPQVSSTLLSILADLNAVVWIVLIRSPISTPPVPFLSLWGPFKARQSQMVSPSPSCSTAFSVFWKGLCICLYFPFLCFLLDPFELQNPRAFMCLILQDGFWFVHMSCSSIIRFQFPAQSSWVTFPTQSCVALDSFY